VIFEVVTRLVYQDLTEKLNSVVSLLRSYNELSDACEVIQLLIKQSSNDATDIDFSNRIPSHFTSSSLVYNLILLIKLITKGEERTYQAISSEEIIYVENQLVKNHSANVGIFLATLIADVKFKESDFSLKTQFIKNHFETLKPDFIGEHIYLHSIMRIRYTQSLITPDGKGKLDSDSYQLYQSVKTNPSLEFLMVKTFNLRLEILSYVLENDDQTISEFLNAIEEDFQKKDYNWTQVVLNFLNSYCADIYFKRHSLEARILLSECEIIIYKYHDDEVWNLLIYQLLTAKSAFELSQGNMELALQYSEKNSQLMRNNHKMDLPSYRENCTKMAKIYEAMGEGQKSIDKKLESIELLKLKMARSKAPDDLYKKELSIDYNNISHVYRNHLNDYRNALKYAKLSLELKSPNEEKSYGISLYSVGRAYDAMQEFDNALKYYQKAQQYFIGELPRDIYQRNILDLNISLAMIQLGSPNSLISLINAVESLETNQMKEYLTNPIKERLRFAKSFIKN
jgi:tetratricopeptide (TPR) repeat protein